MAGGDDDKKKDKKDRKDREKAQRRQQREEEEEAENAEATGGEWKRVKGGVAMQAKPKMFAKDAEINTTVVLKKLSEILAARGKKGKSIHLNLPHCSHVQHFRIRLEASLELICIDGTSVSLQALRILTHNLTVEQKCWHKIQVPSQIEERSWIELCFLW